MPVRLHQVGFWGSVVLTGNPTCRKTRHVCRRFWGSVVLTGNPTKGSDVVIVNGRGEFVTVMKGGAENKRYRNAIGHQGD